LALIVFYKILSTRASSVAYSVLVLALIAWLSLVALGLVNSLLWLYEGVLGVSEGLVISARGFSPITALISRSEVEEKLLSIEGITVEYYLVTPILIKDKVLVLRGVNTSISEDCVLIGENVARELGVQVRDRITLSSIFTGEVYEVEVCEYTRSYVLEASYSLVARIRGVGSGYYSYVVVKGSSEALSRVVEALGLEPGRQKLVGLAVAIFSRVGNETRVTFHRALTEAYITNFGLHRDYILYFALAVSVVSVLGSFIIGLDTTRRFKNTLRVYRLLGVSKRSLVLVATLIGFITVLVASSLSLLLYSNIEVFTLRVLEYTVKPRIEPGLVIVVFSTLLVLYIAGLVSGVMREVE